MKFKDLVYKLMTEHCILEWAFKRRIVEDKIISKAPTIGKHIIKLFIYKDSSYIEKWITEIKDRLDEISELEVVDDLTIDYYDCLYEKYWNVKDVKYNNIIDRIVEQYSDIEHLRVKNISVSQIRDKVREVMGGISILIINYSKDDRLELDKILRNL